MTELKKLLLRLGNLSFIKEELEKNLNHFIEDEKSILRGLEQDIGSIEKVINYFLRFNLILAYVKNNLQNTCGIILEGLPFQKIISIL